MRGKTFVDTNVFIYAHNVDSAVKHRIAERIMQDLWHDGTGSLSTQVLQEFYINVTRKIAKPLPKATARAIVNSYAIWCAETTPEDITVAFQIEDEARIGFWDALIVAAAVKAGADRILSEDLNAGQSISAVLIENPFAQV